MDLETVTLVVGRVAIRRKHEKDGYGGIMMKKNTSMIKKQFGGVVMVAAMAVTLTAPIGAKATTYLGKIDWMTAAPNATTQKSLICSNGGVSYNMGMVTVMANGTTGYTRINQKLTGTSTLYVGYSTMSRNAGTYTATGKHEVSCECKNRAAYGKADGKYIK